MELIAAAATGLLLDALLGDPAWLTHPVVLMGKAIDALEKRLRVLFPATESGELRAGCVLTAILPLGTLLLTGGAVFLAGLVHPALRFALEVFWGWQSLAMRGLVQESGSVRRKLTEGTPAEARRAVARIVGRDTADLSEAGVIRAAVETVAENFSDGVAAPMLYFLLGGAPLALCYKAVNTLDSMVGYKNERYLYFGRAAAKLDDIANWLPSRLAALLLIGAAFLCGENGPNSRRIWKRDRRNHASPNSAQTEAAMAGALGLRLGGPSSYFGKMVEKPTIGDPIREPEPEDIRRANRMMITASVLALLVMSALRLLIVRFIG